MAKGRYYTEDEDNALLNLAHDMQEGHEENVMYVTIAERALRYGIVTGRQRNALAEHISSLLTKENEVQADESTVQNGIDDSVERQQDIEYLIMQRKAEKYDQIKAVTFGTAESWGSGKHALKLNIPKIIRWWYEHETDEFEACIERVNREE